MNRYGRGHLIMGSAVRLTGLAVLLSSCTGLHSAVGGVATTPSTARSTTTGSGPATSSAPAQNASTSTTATPRSSAPTQTTNSPTSTSVSATGRPALCSSAQLSGQLTAFQGAAGNDRLNVVLTNISRTPCTMYGYPGLGFINTAGKVVDIPVVRGSTMITQDPGSTQFTLAAGKTASDAAGFGDTAYTGETCPQIAAFEVTPPNQYTHLLVPMSSTVANNVLSICTPTVSVTAMMPGDTGTVPPAG